MVTSICVVTATLVFTGVMRASAEGPAAKLADRERSRCYDVLIGALDDESRIVRVHAADALISLGRSEAALAAFEPKASTTEPEYRILVWRVLAAAEPEVGKRRMYVERIRAALVAPTSPDQTHAMESLAKLNEPVTDAERRAVHAVADGAGPGSPFALWRLATAGDAVAVDRLAKLLHSSDSVTRFRAAYVLGRLRPTYPAAATALAAALETEPHESPAQPILRAAAGGDRARELLDDTKAAPGDRYFAAMFLAESGSLSDYPRLTGLLDDPSTDLRVSGAFVLLTIDARSLVSESTSKANNGRGRQ
jgi:SSS family solute:Na+ symporter